MNGAQAHSGTRKAVNVNHINFNSTNGDVGVEREPQPASAKTPGPDICVYTCSLCKEQVTCTSLRCNSHGDRCTECFS